MLREFDSGAHSTASRSASIAPIPNAFNMGRQVQRAVGLRGAALGATISGMYRLGWALLPFTLLYEDVGIWLAFWLTAIPSAFYVDPPVQRARHGHQVTRQLGL